MPLDGVTPPLHFTFPTTASSCSIPLKGSGSSPRQQLSPLSYFHFYPEAAVCAEQEQEQGGMASPRDLLTLLLAVHIHLLPLALCASPHADLRKNGATKHKGAMPQHWEEGASALGEPCGVYTLACGRGLRCFPKDGEQSPLQALLQGRGICRSIKYSLHRATTTGFQTRVTESIEKGPCRKLLMSVLQKIELTVIQSDRNIYIPNCDKSGFFKRKQCMSSRGMQRGQCWCVNEKGHKIASRSRHDRTVTCSSA